MTYEAARSKDNPIVLAVVVISSTMRCEEWAAEKRVADATQLT